MTKNEIIDATLKAMREDQGLLAIGEADDDDTNEYEAIVIATLMERLPEGDVRTCDNFRHLGVECCNICHTFYAHYDMYLETGPDGNHAWICCSVRSSLFKLGEHAANAKEERVDLERALSDIYDGASESS